MFTKISKSFINAVRNTKEMRYAILISIIIAVLPILVLASIWMHGDYFKPKYSSTTATVTDNVNYHDVEVNFRATPAIDAGNIISKLEEGTQVTLTGYLKYKPVRNFIAYMGLGRNDFACSFTQVIVDGKVGWVASRYLSVHPHLTDSAALMISLILLAILFVAWLVFYIIYAVAYVKTIKSKQQKRK